MFTLINIKYNKIDMKDKFNLLFIIGNEGTGHSLFHNCDLEPEPYKELHGLIKKYSNNKLLPKEREVFKEEIIELTKNNLGVVCKEWSSFPHGRPTNPMISHDIYGLHKLFGDMEHVNVFYLVLTRNILYSTLSSKNRFDKDESIIYCARMQEMMLSYINSQVQLLPKDKYLIIELTNFQKNIKKFFKLIYERCSMTIDCNYDNIIIADDSKYLKDCNYKYLVEYFDDNRLKQFKFLKDNINFIF
tara:strand:- start:122 stop:856 length:735 start_codon:yes stop_codon:yes gene_type:complete